jgi:hypothetical protein
MEFLQNKFMKDLWNIIPLMSTLIGRSQAKFEKTEELKSTKAKYADYFAFTNKDLWYINQSEFSLQSLQDACKRISIQSLAVEIF